MYRNTLGLVVVVCALAAGRLYGQSPLETALAAAVSLDVVGPDGASGGSGFIVSDDGVIVTAAHVIEGATSAVVRLSSGEEFPVLGVIEIDHDKDYAIIRIAGFDLPTVPLGNSNDVVAGQSVLAIGAPLGLDATISDGLVGQVRVYDGVRLLQITVPVSPGSSGGPVINEAGEVVGLVVSGIRGDGAENLNFALPINYVRGALTLASSATPQPLSQTSTTAVRADDGPGPSPVNDSLELDASVLHGVTFYSEEKDDSYEYEITISYGVTGTTSGASKITRTERRTVFYDDKTVLRMYNVSFWLTDGTGSGESYASTAVDSRFTDFAQSQEWEISGSAGTADSAGVWTSEFQASPGVIPISMVSGVLAVLDSIAIPSQLSVRQGWYDFTRRRWVESDFLVDFIGTDEVSVRVPRRAGAPCNKDTRTREIRMEVVEARIEAELIYWADQRPHLRLMPDTECVSFPLNR